MSMLKLEPHYIVEFSAQELRLVGLALSGKLHGADARDALKLNDKLMQGRQVELANIVRVASGAADIAARLLSEVVVKDSEGIGASES